VTLKSNVLRKSVNIVRFKMDKRDAWSVLKIIIFRLKEIHQFVDISLITTSKIAGWLV
jgi:hypothetical protein